MYNKSKIYIPSTLKIYQIFEIWHKYTQVSNTGRSQLRLLFRHKQWRF